MTIVFNKYTDYVGKLQKTIQRMGRNARIVVLEDNGFLPDQISSPYKYFVYEKNREALKEKELYYNFLEVPEFWEIRLSGMHGTVYDMSCKKADIYFTDPIEKKNVQRVEWCMESGWVYKIDHYNKYAQKYASEFLDIDGNVESKVFYSRRNQEVIIEQPVNDVVTLLENGKVKGYFTSHDEFTEYCLEEICQGEKAVLFAEDNDSIRLLNLKPNKRHLWEYILFSKRELLERYTQMGGENGYFFYAIPEEYPANSAKGEALVLTAADRLEGIEYLIQELQEVTFHVAANTQVSDKLYGLGKWENVKIYPQISRQDLDALWDRCDFYLDINYYWEIHNAIDMAHQKNLLIMGFENTLHHRELVAEACIFAPSDAAKLALTMRELVDHVEQVQEQLVIQQEKRLRIWKNMKGFV